MAVDLNVFGSETRTGGGSAATFFVKNKAGEAEEIEIPYDQFSAPLDGWYVLKIKGFSAPYEDTGGM